ncbi:unnamed protein product [Schistosoma margrebowiei]|uniref:Uncharacterized protein n=1 Tax=Schistosoma margrebowiei TaxID=48269 RepID=A0A183MT44_9TREM|nr:unnamed protein product [Schistosoma margrebowiei]
MENIINLNTNKLINQNDTLNETLINSFNIHKSIKSIGFENESIILDNNQISINQLMIPLILFGLIINFLIINTIIKILYKQIPWIIFLFYIIILDQFDLIICIIDLIIASYYEIKLFIIIEFFGRFYCQIIPMLYNLIKHVHSILYIIFTIETMKLYLYPWQQLNKTFKQIKQFIQNILILIIVITIILNCQFIWTYDLSKLETFILHERILHNIYKCDFALTWILSPIFLNYIWPFIDHIIGDILPCIICLLSGLISYILHRFRVIKYQKEINNKFDCHHHNSSQEKYLTIFIHDNDKKIYNKNYYLSYMKWIMKMIRVFNLICIIHGIFLIPRCLYYLMKYFFFISRVTNRNNVHNHELDDFQNQTDQVLLNTIGYIMELLKPYEIYLSNYESALRFINFIEIYIRAIILLFGIKEFKANLYTHLTTIINYCKRLSLCNLYGLIPKKCTNVPFINYGKKVFIQNSGQQAKSVHRTTTDLPLNHEKVKDVEMSEHLHKKNCSSDDLSNDNTNNSNEQKKTPSFVEYGNTMNSQTSLITNTQFNHTTYKCNESNLIKINKLTSNLNINSKYDWYNLKKYKSNSKNHNFNDISNSELFREKYQIIYL